MSAGHKLIRIEEEQDGATSRRRWVCECASLGQWSAKSDHAVKAAHTEHVKRHNGPKGLRDLLKLD